MPEPHPSDERLVDLALNDLGSPEQDALSAHLARCEACRRRYARVADSVDGVLAAAPSIAPPPGFTGGVLAAMGVDPPRAATLPTLSSSPSGSAPPSSPGPEVPRRRALVLAAVAAAIALLAGAIGTAVVIRALSPPPPAASLAGTALTTSDGETVGSVQSARYEGSRVLVLNVIGRPGATYDCRVRLADGTQQTLASWTLPADGSASWVVDRPEGQLTQMDLVAPSGRVWASATL
jgi:anti-sigma factor RsiW